jgi:nondiscriminating glutamyl-tRNA synthetase
VPEAGTPERSSGKKPGPVRVRFAPAPTGSLHVGGARTALFNYLFARREGGAFVLRSEDTDAARSSLESERVIQDDLRWLGLSWDEGTDIGGPYAPYRQTDRTDRYGLAAARLLETEKAYLCYCTLKELETQRAAAERAGVTPRYAGTCRELTREQRAALDAQGRTPAVRFLMPQRDIFVEDVVRGSVHFPEGSIGDFVIMKSDGGPAYNFAAVVDDAEMAITHVIRGDEHLPNTPRQVVLYEALDLPLPLFAHVSMILAPDHQKLSKRHGATSVAEYREQGYLPAAMINYLALLGWSPGDDQEFFSLAELAEVFSLERVSKSPAVFDQGKLRWFNAHYLRALPRDERAALFAQWAARDATVAASADMQDPRWRALLADALTDHVEILSQVPALTVALLAGDVTIEPGARDALADPAARALVEELAAIARSAADRGALAEAASKEALAALGVKHGVRGRALFRPIRIAVTGEEHGIELPVLLPLLGPARVAARIRSALSQQQGM